jgi:hypothetical protein
MSILPLTIPSVGIRGKTTAHSDFKELEKQKADIEASVKSRSPEASPGLRERRMALL